MVDKVHWTFYAYQTPAGGKDVYEWFCGLEDDIREEAIDVLTYLQPLPRSLWAGPEFDVLSDGISEVRFKVNVLHVKRIFRIYGAFWPAGKRFSYTFLIGKNKKEDNDRRGKNEAIKRLRQLERGEALIHELKF